MRVVIVSCLATLLLSPALSSVAGLHSSALAGRGNVASDGIDEQLYSRQLLVYGKGAQRQLSQAAVLVHGNGYVFWS